MRSNAYDAGVARALDAPEAAIEGIEGIEDTEGKIVEAADDTLQPGCNAVP